MNKTIIAEGETVNCLEFFFFFFFLLLFFFLVIIHFIYISYLPYCRLSVYMYSGGAGGIAARGQIYRNAPIGVLEIHLRAKLPPPSPILERKNKNKITHTHTHPLCSATVYVCPSVYLYLFIWGFYVWLFIYLSICMSFCL